MSPNPQRHEAESPSRQRARAPWLIAAVAAALMFAGCAPMPPVELRGAPGSAAALVGEWDGSFSSRAAGRNGSIWFRLVAGEDHAHGDVLMKSERESQPYMKYGPGGTVRDHNGDAQTFLSIHFVRVSGQAVDGVLEPYWDPSCGCRATTSFVGYLFENRITGTFFTHFDDDTFVTGSWSVTRRRPAKR